MLIFYTGLNKKNYAAATIFYFRKNFFLNIIIYYANKWILKKKNYKIDQNYFKKSATTYHLFHFCNKRQNTQHNH